MKFEIINEIYNNLDNLTPNTYPPNSDTGKDIEKYDSDVWDWDEWVDYAGYQYMGNVNNRILQLATTFEDMVVITLKEMKRQGVNEAFIYYKQNVIEINIIDEKVICRNLTEPKTF